MRMARVLSPGPYGMRRVALLLAVALASLPGGHQGAVDYCAEDLALNVTISTPLLLTKELAGHEYALDGAFQSLHCCAAGYSSVEWFKDGRPYPWPYYVSSLILYPESANQTIYTGRVTPTDAGNYSCMVVNDTTLLRHDITLTVFERSSYTDMPLATYETPSVHSVMPGQAARLYCEAFVGNIDLPDAYSEVKWRRSEPGMTIDGPRFRTKKISREGGLVLGEYLFIEGVRHSDYGEYVCTASNIDFQIIRMSTLLTQPELIAMDKQEIPWARVAIRIAVIVFSLISLVVIYKRFMLAMILFCRRLCQGKIEEQDDGKQFDALVCYAAQDADFALGVLVSTLQSRFGYTVLAVPMTAVSSVHVNATSASLCRRLILVASPSSIDPWTPVAILQTLKELSAINLHLICVTLKALPEAEACKSAEGEELNAMLKRLIVIRCNTSGYTWDLWPRLRLAMPVRGSGCHLVTASRPATIGCTPQP